MSDTTLMTDGTQTTQAAASSTADGNTAAPQGEGTTNTAGNQQATAAEPKPGEAGSTQAAKADDKSTKPDGEVPEKYNIEAPEGVSFDAELLGEFEGIAKELKMSQKDAQKVSTLGVKLAQKIETKQSEAFQTVATEWANASTVDKEFGGEKLQENLAIAKKAMDAFGTPELRELLEKSRFGNNPEVIRFMYRAGKAISEDRMVTGGNFNTAGVNKPTAEILYNNS